MTMGQRIRKERQRWNITQLDIARAVGKTQTAVSYWEGDKRAPSVEDMATIARLLFTSIDYLVIGEPAGILIGSDSSAPAPLSTAGGVAKET